MKSRARIVKNIAIGSFVPDSASSVAPTFGEIFFPLKAAKTAAASVEPMMAPNRKDSIQSKPNTKRTATAISPVVNKTPIVASEADGASTLRIDDHFVCSPPSNKMTTSAATPII